MRLTDLSIRALKPEARGAKVYYDDVIPGFGIRVARGGTKSYILTHGVRRQRKTIGRVGIISLSGARAEAKRRLAEYTLGSSKAASIGWNSALKAYLAYVRDRRKQSTADEYERLLRKHFKFGETKVADILPDDIQRRLDKLAKSEKFHAFTALRPFMNWCFRKGYLTQNPMARLDKPVGSRARSRILTNDELRKIWRAAGDDTFGTVVKLLILTGQRLGEISNIAAEQIGDGTLHFPDTKNGRPHTIPLGKTAQTLIHPIRYSNSGAHKVKLDGRSGVTGWTLHDLRRTFASGLASIGVAIPTIERLLNHVSGTFAGIVGTYQRYDYAKEMRDAVALWDSHIAKITRSAKLAAA